MIDYLQEDFTKNGETYDIIFDAVGKHSFRRCKDSLNPGGLYLPTDGFRQPRPVAAAQAVRRQEGGVRAASPHARRRTSCFLKELIETGEYRPVIDRSYPLEDVVEATRYVETQQKTGNVVLTVNA